LFKAIKFECYGCGRISRLPSTLLPHDAFVTHCGISPGDFCTTQLHSRTNMRQCHVADGAASIHKLFYGV